METAQRLGVVDPRALLQLPAEWLTLHLAHTRNIIQAQYELELDKDGKPIMPAGHLARLRAGIETWRERAPSPEELSAARRLVAALPADHPAAIDARQTLEAA
ncbi:MAG: hypothetical protein AAFV53_16570 [Myxococcota bacterium]